MQERPVAKQENKPTPNNQRCWDYEGFSLRMSARLEKVRRMLQTDESSPSPQKEQEFSRA